MHPTRECSTRLPLRHSLSLTRPWSWMEDACWRVSWIRGEVQNCKNVLCIQVRWRLRARWTPPSFLPDAGLKRGFIFFPYKFFGVSSLYLDYLFILFCSILVIIPTAVVIFKFRLLVTWFICKLSDRSASIKARLIFHSAGLKLGSTIITFSPFSCDGILWGGFADTCEHRTGFTDPNLYISSSIRYLGIASGMSPTNIIDLFFLLKRQWTASRRVKAFQLPTLQRVVWVDALHRVMPRQHSFSTQFPYTRYDCCRTWTCCDGAA